jgi:hypothetical protein
MLFSKKYNTRSSRKRSIGKRISKKRNMMSGGFNVYVKDTTGNGFNATIDMFSNYTISDLKDTIVDTFNADGSNKVVKNEVVIVFNGKPCDNDSLELRDYNIQRDSTVYILKKGGSMWSWKTDQRDASQRDFDRISDRWANWKYPGARPSDLGDVEEDDQ